jgi:hypothetical protein
MPFYGYARVSTIDQDLAIQRAALKAAGCEVIRAEKASGTRRDGRSELQVLLDFLHAGDTLMVTRIDRLARSLKDLQDIVAWQAVHQRRERGWQCRSRLKCAGFIRSTGRSSAGTCGSSALAAFARAVVGRMAQLFAACRTDADLTPLVRLGAVIVDGARAGPTSRRQPGYDRRVSSSPPPTSITTGQQSAPQLEEPLPALPPDPRPAARRITYLLRRALGDLFLGPIHGSFLHLVYCQI